MREERKDVIMYKLKSRVEREVVPLSEILWPGRQRDRERACAGKEKERKRNERKEKEERNRKKKINV